MGWADLKKTYGLEFFLKGRVGRVSCADMPHGESDTYSAESVPSRRVSRVGHGHCGLFEVSVLPRSYNIVDL